VFLSHFAVGLAAKRAAPVVSLGTLFLSCQLADIVWPNFVLLGIEHVAIAPGNTTVTPLDFISYPYSHSLVALALWALLAAALYRLLAPRSPGPSGPGYPGSKDPGLLSTQGLRTAMFVIAGVVLSHWVLDVASHRPDMPIAPGMSAKLGFGLWESLPATLVVEFTLFVIGLGTYMRVTVARDRTGTTALWSFASVLVMLYLGSVFGPPPPTPQALAWSAEGVWLFVLWGYWIDRHRSARIMA
jgi:hypothetical protein